MIEEHVSWRTGEARTLEISKALGERSNPERRKSLGPVDGQKVQQQMDWNWTQWLLF